MTTMLSKTATTADPTVPDSSAKSTRADGTTVRDNKLQVMNGDFVERVMTDDFVPAAEVAAAIIENGVPRVVEFAFDIHREGLTAGHGPSRKFITGVNWSPGINNPFRQLGRSGEGLDGILTGVRANTSQPVIAVLHLACPRVAYTDRGKSAIVVEGDVKEGADGEEE
jgi:hypothetical protein